MAKKPTTKKQKIRSWRKGQSVKNKDGSTSTHRASYASADVTNKRGKTKRVYTVYPTIAPKKGKENSTKPKDWKKQTAKEAYKRGETVDFKSKKRAARVAAGSWKKGAAKRSAMKSYRASRKK